MICSAPRSTKCLQVTSAQVSSEASNASCSTVLRCTPLRHHHGHPNLSISGGQHGEGNSSLFPPASRSPVPIDTTANIFAAATHIMKLVIVSRGVNQPQPTRYLWSGGASYSGTDLTATVGLAPPQNQVRFNRDRRESSHLLRPRVTGGCRLDLCAPPGGRERHLRSIVISPSRESIETSPAPTSALNRPAPFTQPARRRARASRPFRLLHHEDAIIKRSSQSALVIATIQWLTRRPEKMSH